MPALERTVSLRGPKFYYDGDPPKLMFVNHLDGSTRFGPREATEADRADHAAAYEALMQGEGAQPFRPLATFEDPQDLAERPAKRKG